MYQNGPFLPSKPLLVAKILERWYFFCIADIGYLVGVPIRDTLSSASGCGVDNAVNSIIALDASKFLFSIGAETS